MWCFNVHALNPHNAMQASPTHNSYEPHVIPFDNDNEDDMPTNQQLAIHSNYASYNPVYPTETPKRVPTTTGSTTQARTRVPAARSTEYHRRAYDLPSTKNLIEYLHCACGSPKKSTFQQAVKAGNYRSFPGLSVEMLPDTAPQMQPPQYLAASHKHQRD